jgi:ApaG protein
VSDVVTRGVRVRVRSAYVEERSAPAEGQYFFAYHVRIANEGDETVQLVSRHWVITDGDGREEHVKGPGVVGEQPILAPGESFEYTSFCPLRSPVGSMHGTYEMRLPGGGQFDAQIAPFSLAVPTALN